MDKYDEILKKYGVDNGGGNVFNPQASQENTVDTLSTAWGIKPSTNVVVKPKESFIKDATGDISQVGTEIKQAVKDRNVKIEANKARQADGTQGEFRTGMQNLGQVLGFGADSIGAIFKGAVKTVLPQGAEDVVKQKTQEAIKGLIDTPFVAGGDQNIGNTIINPLLSKYDELKKTNPKLASDIDSALGLADFASNFVGAEAVKPALVAGKNSTEQLVKTGAKNAIIDAVDQGARAIDPLKNGIKTVKNAIVPDITPAKALGEVLQGKTDDLVLAQKAIESIDIKGIKTYAEFADALQKKIPELAQIVDKNLKEGSKDPLSGNVIAKTLPELATIEKSASGKEVVTNYVENALNQLSELYGKTGDAVEKANIDELIVRATTDGLDKQEINNIARQYGSEFGSKAFSKVTGDPLTSVNAQMYENTRRGVKEVARSGITDKLAQKADDTMHAIYNTNKLIEKNVESVNALKQKMREKGIVGKTVSYLYGVTDTLSGGSLSSIATKLFKNSKDEGLNFIELEKLLESNLKVLDKAKNANSKAEIEKIIEEDLKKFFEPFKGTMPAGEVKKKPSDIINQGMDIINQGRDMAKSAVDNLSDPAKRQRGSIDLGAISDSITGTDPILKSIKDKIKEFGVAPDDASYLWSKLNDSERKVVRSHNGADIEEKVKNYMRDNNLAGGMDSTSNSYHMAHRPTESGATGADISLNGEYIPKDVYEHPEWYFNMNDKATRESFNAVNKIRGKPEAEVTIYRASPSDTINSGDWISLSKTYAKEHNLNLNDRGINGRVTSMKVKAKDIQFAGDDINEFGYFPKN